MPQSKSPFVIGRESNDDRWLYTVETQQGEVLDYATTPEQAQAKIEKLLAERRQTREEGWKANREAWALFRSIRAEAAKIISNQVNAQRALEHELA